MTVSDTIVKQIGGKAFYMMGAKNSLIKGKDSIQFDIKNCKKWRRIVVRLVNDTYTVAFYKMGKAPDFRITTKEVSGVYADSLHFVIENETGLYLNV